jgi:hypothetical protein
LCIVIRCSSEGGREGGREEEEEVVRGGVGALGVKSHHVSKRG